MKNNVSQNSPFNWMKFKKIYFTLSLLVIAVGVFSIFKWQFLLGIDFAGGTNIEYKFAKEESSERIQIALRDKHIDVAAIVQNPNNIFDLKLGQIDESQKQVVKEVLANIGGEGSSLLSFEQVGPSFSRELLQKTLYAILISAGAILVWIAYQFKSWKFGLSATIATFHDALVIIGLFSLFGHFFGAEIDYLFVTALLTILSFSVHDTIVVYDRIREIRRKHGGNVSDVANRALSETMRRSIFNSFTIILMLLSLSIFGGNSIKWFAIALLVGTISGTYSSPFVAVPLLVTLEQFQKRSIALPSSQKKSSR